MLQNTRKHADIISYISVYIREMYNFLFLRIEHVPIPCTEKNRVTAIILHLSIKYFAHAYGSVKRPCHWDVTMTFGLYNNTYLVHKISTKREPTQIYFSFNGYLTLSVYMLTETRNVKICAYNT